VLAERGAESEEKREPVSDITLELVDSLKVLDPDGRLEKGTEIPQCNGLLVLASVGLAWLLRPTTSHDAGAGLGGELAVDG
jgi:hypothetical protein